MVQFSCAVPVPWPNTICKGAESSELHVSVHLFAILISRDLHQLASPCCCPALSAPLLEPWARGIIALVPPAPKPCTWIVALLGCGANTT